MSVPSYQMHNVLNVYSKQLRQNMAAKKKNKVPQKPQVNKFKLTPEGKRQATIEKISKVILNKISRYGRLKKDRQRNTEHVKVSSNEETALHKQENKTFVFNEIDAIDQKSKNTLSVNDSSFLIEKFEQLAKKANDKKPESWI
ncbi:MAG: hypothetical protein GY850_31985 [bacterium]|nr:hypothetical protein [bacterium]